MAHLAHRRKASAIAIGAMVAASIVGPLAGSAAAAITSVTASPQSQIVQLGKPANFTGDYTVDLPGGTEDIKVFFSTGSKAGTYGDPNDENPVFNTYSYSYTPTAPGTDTLRFFADNNSNGAFDSGEPFDDVTVTVAGPPAAVALSPDTGTAVVGTCVAMSVSSSDSAGAPNPGQKIFVDLQQAGANVAFCDPNGTAASADPAGQSPAYDPSTGVQASSARRLAVTTGPNGEAVVFGVQTTQPSALTVTAFADNNNNNLKDGTDPSDTSTITFSDNGAGSVTTVNAQPKTGRGYKGEALSFTATLTNSSGAAVPGVTPSFKVTGANPQQANCTTSNNSGQSTCGYTPANAGTDTIVVWVTNSTSTTTGPDSTEPQDTITRDIANFSSADLTVTMTCQGTKANTSAKACVNPTDDPTDTLTALVTGPDGPDANTAPDPVSGVIVHFAVTATGSNGTDDDSSVSPVDVATGSDGTATTTLTNPVPVAGDSATVTVTIPNQADTDSIMPGTQTSSDATTTSWQTRTPSLIDLKPDVLTAQVGSTNTFVATVTDQFGGPAANQNVDFVVENTASTSDTDRPANNGNYFDHITDQNGEASLTFTDAGPPLSGGSNQVRAWADFTENDTRDSNEPQDISTVNFVTQSTTVNQLDIDVDGTCNPTMSSPGHTNNNSRDVTLDSNPSDDQFPVCALILNASGTPIAGHVVSFTISGVGKFVKADGTDGGKSTTAYSDANGIAHVVVRSDGGSGTQSITASIDNASETGTITYTSSTKLAVTSPASYYTTVPGGGSVTFRGTGGQPGETLVVHRKVGNGSYATLSNGPVVASDGTWSFPLRVTTTTGVYFSGQNGDSGVKVIKTTLNITFPSTYYYTVAKGQRTAIYGSGALPGAVLEIWTKSSGQASFVKRPNTVTATSYGTWALRFNVYAPMAIYFRGTNGKSDTVVYRVS